MNAPRLASSRTGFRIAAAAVLAAVLSAAGCAHRGTSNFMKAINSIEPGTAMDRVKDALGSPDEKREGTAPVRPAPPVGSPEGVLVTVPPGVHYREWIYKRGDSRYHVFFVPSAGKPDKWEVLAVRSAPAAKVY
jgi:hypothetical protein